MVQIIDEGISALRGHATEKVDGALPCLPTRSPDQPTRSPLSPYAYYVSLGVLRYLPTRSPLSPYAYAYYAISQRALCYQCTRSPPSAYALTTRCPILTPRMDLRKMSGTDGVGCYARPSSSSYAAAQRGVQRHRSGCYALNRPGTTRYEPVCACYHMSGTGILLVPLARYGCGI